MNTPGLIPRITDTYALLVRLASSLRSPLLLVLRLYWGWSFFQTGMGKLGNLGQTAEFFGTLGIPFPTLNAAMAGATECFGGLLLLVGLASRLVTLPLIITMIVAYLTADLEAVKGIFSDPDKFLEAAPFLFLLTCVIVFVFGPGAFSLDHLLGKKLAPVASAKAESPQST
jgi:putative oxidoreductase